MNLDWQLSQLEIAQLVRRIGEEEATYMFKHALVQETAYRSLLKNRRRDTHRCVVIVYEQLYADRLNEFAALLSEHCWNGDWWEKAAEYAIKAGMTALRVYAVREALVDFERALAALERVASPSPTETIDALTGWAEAALKIRPYNEQLEKLGRAEKIARDDNDKRRLVRVLYRIGTVHTTQGHNLRAIPPLTECFALANELDDERLVVIPTLFMGVAIAPSKPRESVGFLERAIELARKYDDLNTLAVAWSAKGMAHARLGEFSSAYAALDNAFAMVEQLKSPSAQSDVYLFAAWAFLDLGDSKKGLHYGQLCVNTARVAENVDCMCGGYDCLGFHRLAEPNLPQAIDTFREAIRSSQYSGAEVFENMGRAGLAMAEYYSGQTRALADLNQAYAHAKELRDEATSAMLAQTLGRIYLMQDDPARAESLLDEALDYFRRVEMVPQIARTLETKAQVYAQQGRMTERDAMRAEAMQWQQTLIIDEAKREN